MGKEITLDSDSSKELKIYVVSVFLDKHGFGYRVHDILVKEKGKSYVGEGKRISKDKFSVIDSIYIETHKSIRYHTYCLDGDQQKSIDMLKAHVISKLLEYKQEIELLFSFIK